MIELIFWGLVGVGFALCVFIIARLACKMMIGSYIKALLALFQETMFQVIKNINKEIDTKISDAKQEIKQIVTQKIEEAIESFNNRICDYISEKIMEHEMNMHPTHQA
ncbi:MAG: hypothetical protein Q6363_008050 [Candidatus Njordarchaeota archaeon]